MQFKPMIYSACLLAAACSVSENTDKSEKVGVILDSQIEGLAYTTTSNTNVRYTNTKGEFFYKEGESVQFLAGDINIGAALGASKISLLDLDQGKLSDKVTRIASFLQTLDENADPSDGIQITEATRGKLKGKKLDFNKTEFDTELDTLATEISKTKVDGDFAKEHFINTLTAEFGKKELDEIETSAGSIKISKLHFVPSTQYNFPAEGGISKTFFPKGIIPGLGSGLTLKEVGSDGAYYLYAHTDRGPNTDAPKYFDGTNTFPTKVFPSPNFVPAFALLKVLNGKISVEKYTGLKDADGKNLSGMPIPAGSVGTTGEVALGEDMKPIKDSEGKIKFDINGIDPEGVAVDNEGKLWLCDEYGPFIMQVDPLTGKTLQKFSPGNGLPAVLAKRIANRGFEGIAFAKETNKIYAVVQSVLEDKSIKDSKGKALDSSKVAIFVRLVEFDIATKTTKMFALPLDVSAYAKVKDAKMGDLAYVPGSNGKQFLLIEQGAIANGMRNTIQMIDISNATDITNMKMAGDHKTYANGEIEFATKEELAIMKVAMVNKYMMFNMRDMDSKGRKWGWLAEKAEGLAIVSDDTIIVTNDSDFGVGAYTKKTTGIDTTKIDDYSVDSQGAFSLSGKAVTDVMFQIKKLDLIDSQQRVWIIKLPKKISEFAMAMKPVADQK